MHAMPMVLPFAEIFGFLRTINWRQTTSRTVATFYRLVGVLADAPTIPHDAAHGNDYGPHDAAHGNDYGMMRRQQIEAANSVLLHELYFRNLAVKPMKPSADVLDNLKRQMGSFESWRADFVECARIAPDWAILEYDPYDGRWHNLPASEEDAGGWVGGDPLLDATWPRTPMSSTITSARSTSRVSWSTSIGTPWRALSRRRPPLRKRRNG